VEVHCLRRVSTEHETTHLVEVVGEIEAAAHGVENRVVKIDGAALARSEAFHVRPSSILLVLDPAAPFGVDSTSPGRSFSILP
jgi:hypothetical protein